MYICILPSISFLHFYPKNRILLLKKKNEEGERLTVNYRVRGERVCLILNEEDFARLRF